MGGVSRHPARLTAINYFTEWWLRSYTNYPLFVIEQLSPYRMESMLSQTLVEYINGKSIEDSYRIMDESIAYHQETAKKWLKDAGLSS